MEPFAELEGRVFQWSAIISDHQSVLLSYMTLITSTQTTLPSLPLSTPLQFRPKPLTSHWQAIDKPLTSRVTTSNSELKIPWKSILNSLKINIKFIVSLLEIDFYSLTVIFLLRLFFDITRIFHFFPWLNGQFLDCQGLPLVSQLTSRSRGPALG